MRLSVDDACREERRYPRDLVAVRVRAAEVRVAAEDPGDREQLDLDACLLASLSARGLGRCLAGIDGARGEAPPSLDVTHEQVVVALPDHSGRRRPEEKIVPDLDPQSFDVV